MTYFVSIKECINEKKRKELMGCKHMGSKNSRKYMIKRWNFEVLLKLDKPYLIQVKQPMTSKISGATNANDLKFNFLYILCTLKIFALTDLMLIYGIWCVIYANITFRARLCRNLYVRSDILNLIRFLAWKIMEFL